MGSDPSFVIEETPDGRRLIVTGAWTAAARRKLESGEVDSVWLNYARGFRERSLEFLDGLPIRRLLLLARTMRDISPLYRLRDAG